MRRVIDELNNAFSFKHEQLRGWEHIIYNLLVQYYNSPSSSPLVEPICIFVEGKLRLGFKFTQFHDPRKWIPELWAQDIIGQSLQAENKLSSVFLLDLYKFYYDNCMNSLSQNFTRVSEFTFLYEDIPLFVPNGSLKAAEHRIEVLTARITE